MNIRIKFLKIKASAQKAQKNLHVETLYYLGSP
jgi:hypothetical protein